VSKKRSTYPSHYYARQALPVKQPVVLEYRKRGYIAQDGEWIAAMLGLGVCGFAFGMLLAAWLMGAI
jgi:hypothetical protein